MTERTAAGKPRTTRTSPERMTPAQRLVLLIAILASFVSFLDGTVVNVALPAIDRELGGGIATQQWVVDAYLITLGAFILVAGSLSDLFGRMLVLRIGLIAFGVASLACAAAPTAEILIIARAVQGVGGALLVPSSLALITSTFDDATRSRAIGIWTASTTGATLVGPLVGGAFVDLLSWRLVFLINVVPIAVVLVLMMRVPHIAEKTTKASVDFAGAILCAAGLGGVVYALIEQSNYGWASPIIWAPFALGVACFVGFLVREKTAKEPMMPLDLFKARNFWAGNVATTFIYAALSLLFLVLVIYLQQGAGLPATLAGLAAIPSTFVMVLFSDRVGTLSGRYGPRFFMTVGPLIMAVGAALFLMIGDPFDYWWQVLPGVVIFGVGLTLTVTPLTAAVLGAIEPERSGIASAVNNAVSRVAGLLAVAFLGVISAGSLDLDGLHRTVVVCAVLLAAGGVASFLGIRNTADAKRAAERA